MTFYVVIPARLGSTRLPNKPLADLGGKPMVVRVAERAELAGANRIIVATDSAAVLDICQKFGVEAKLTNPEHPSGTDRIAEVSAMMRWPDDAVIVNVQGDEPLIDPDLIKVTAALIGKDTPMATAAHLLENTEDIFNPNVVKVVLNRHGHALYFSRAAIPWHRDSFVGEIKVFPDGYVPLRHIGLYAFRNDFLQTYLSLPASLIEQHEALEQLRVLWHGYTIAVHVTRTIPEAGVDTPDDLKRVQKHFMSL